MNNELHNKKIAFVGGGNMAQALISGLLSSGTPADSLMVSDPDVAIQKKLITDGIRIAASAEALTHFADVIVLAIKPQLFSGVLPTLKGKLTNQLVISVAAGISVSTIATLLSHDNIIRAMPNTPALIRQGATGIYADNSVSEADRRVANAILSATGLVVWVDSEDLMHAVTAVSGSAPAYFFYVMETMIAEGQSLGLSEIQAKQLVLQTALGAAKMAMEGKESPATLREKVTSPNGTTHAALESMTADQLDNIIAKGMQACAKRSEAMMREAMMREAMMREAMMREAMMREAASASTTDE